MTIGNLRLLGLTVVLAALAGCSGFKEGLDKSLSGWMDADCRSDRFFSSQSVCQERKPVTDTVKMRAPKAPLYCYPTLGDIDCYSTPEPRRIETQAEVEKASAATRG
jgi:hypothetical protein